MNQIGRNVLVTGASRGIGRGIAVALAAAGHSVAVNCAGNLKAAEETVSICESVKQFDEQKFLIYKADISVKEDRSRMLKDAVNDFGEIHSLVNNAGIAPKNRTDLLQMSEDSLDDLLSVNLKGGFFLTQELSNIWLKQEPESSENRSIIFITSISAETVSLNRGDYCIAKAGLSMTVKLFARRLAEENISVFEVRPGIIMTDMTAGIKDKYEELINHGLVPQRRWGTPEDIGKAVNALVSDNFIYSTGSVINVDGGLHVPEL